jgi:hypothetical protein
MRVERGIKQRWEHFQGNQRWQSLSREITDSKILDPNRRPVILFNASTRLQSMSQNAAYSFLTALGLELQGVPVIQFVCRSGLTRCVLGSNRDNFEGKPPCDLCIRQSRMVFKSIETVWFAYREDEILMREIQTLPVAQLEGFEYRGKPLGFWAVNSLRWFLRRHHLKDDPQTRQFFRAFICSSWNVYQQFSQLLEAKNPQAVVLFNGMFYPEAAARYACLEKGVRVITHEVGLRPFTAFFTTGEATAYPMKIGEDFQLTPAMNEKLDEYLSARFKGNFSMAGIRFWPEMSELSADFLAKAAQFKKIVPVFTNVIFDTSQVHANTIFPHMFAWLDDVRQAALSHPEILFVIRAHPDESRPGKESRESVADWVENSGIRQQPNVLFIDSNEFISSYELIQRSHLVMVYNSTIGLEASLLGRPVLAGGKARFTQLATAFYPASIEHYKAQLEKLLSAYEIQVPPEFRLNSRRFLYFQLYATSLDFSHFLREDRFWKGYVIPKSFPVRDLLPENSATMKVLMDGILDEGSFNNPL